MRKKTPKSRGWEHESCFLKPLQTLWQTKKSSEEVVQPALPSGIPQAIWKWPSKIFNQLHSKPSLTKPASSLGDSGFAQFRLNAVHYDSNPQTHAFNTPYQLSIIPPKILARSRIFGSMPLRDFPRDASVTSHDVRHGDVLMFATDGVWDNLSSNELLRIVSRYMTGFQAWQGSEKGTTVGKELGALTTGGGIPKEKENTLQTLLAVAITGEAKAASQNSRRDGPFAKEVHKFYPHEDFHGGKVDDICVVVAVVVDASDASA